MSEDQNTGYFGGAGPSDAGMDTHDDKVGYFGSFDAIDPNKWAGGAGLPPAPTSMADLGHSVMAGVHGVASTGAGAIASMESDPSREAGWQQTAQDQARAAEESRGAVTPGSQGWRTWAAEQAPGLVALAAPAVAATAAAGPLGGAAVVSGLMGGQTRGDVYNRLTGEGITPTSGQLAEATVIGAAGGLATEAAGPLVGKIATSKLIDAALGVAAPAAVMGTQQAGQEALTESAEIGAGKRAGYDPSAIVTEFKGGAEFGGAFGLPHAVLGHSGVHRDTTQKGGEATVPRTPDAQTATETKPRAGVSTPTDDVTAKGPAPPSSPVVDPDVAAAAKGDPITPESKQPTVTQPEPVVAQGEPVKPAGVQEKAPAPPAPEVPPATPAPPEKPQTVTEPTPLAAPDDAVRAQHAELIDKTNPREAMIYPPNVQPLDINRYRYGQGSLQDGRTIQYDRSGPSRHSAAKIDFADKNNRLDELLPKQSVDKAPETPVAGTPGAVAAERGEATPAPEAAAPVLARAEPVIGSTTDDAQAEAAPAQPIAQPVTPESKPLATGRVLEAQDAASIRARDAAAATEAIRSQTVEEQLKAKAREQAGIVEPKGPSHKGVGVLDKQARDNDAAAKIVKDHPHTGSYANAEGVLERAKLMVREAAIKGIDIPKVFGEGHPWSAAMVKLREAKDLLSPIKREVGETKDNKLGRFMDREHMIDTGRVEEALAARRSEGAAMLGSPEGKEVTGRIDDLEKPEDIKEAHESEAVHETPSEHAGESEEAHEEKPIDALAAAREERDRKIAAARAESEEMRKEAASKEPPAPKAAMGFKTTKPFEGMRPKISGKIKLQEMEDDGKILITDKDGNPDEITSLRQNTIGDIIKEHFDLNRYSPELRPMMTRLRDAIIRIAGNTETHFISHDDMIKIAGRAHGVYNMGANVVMLNADKLLHDTPLHEALHAVMANTLEKSPDLQKLMGRLHDELRDNLTSVGRVDRTKLQGMANALSDPEEMLTELMTNPNVQNFFRNAKISDQLARDIGIPKWRKATMWEGVLGVIRRALGLGPRDTSALEAAMSLTEQTMWRDPRGVGDLMEASARMANNQLKYQKMGPEEIGKFDGEKLGRSVKGFTNKLGGVTKDMLTDNSATIKKKGDRLSSEPMLYEHYKDMFKGDDGHDNMRDRLDATQRRAARVDELSEPGHELARQLRELASKHGNDIMAKAEAVRKTMNEFGVWPHHELGEGKNAHLAIRKGAEEEDAAFNKQQARTVHPELTEDFNALPEEVRGHLLKEAQHYTDTANALAKEKARDYIEKVEPPKGSTKEEIVQRMLSDKLTDEDKAHYAEKGIKNLEADDFQKRKGPYYPAERYGDFVLQAEHAVPAPRGSDVEHDGTALANNVRRFATREAMHDFNVAMAKKGLLTGVTTRYHMEDAQGNRIYKVPGTDRKITSEEAASSGYSSPKREYYVRVQNEHVSFHKSMSDGVHAREALQKDGLTNISQVMDRSGRGVDKSFTSEQTRALLSNVDRREDLTDAEKERMKEHIRETAVVSQSGSKIMKNFARTQKVQGAAYRGDAITKYTQGAARYLASLEYQPKIDAAMDAMKTITKERRNDEFSSDRSRAMNEMTARSYNTRMDSLYPQSSPAVQRLMNMAYVNDMASASHLLTHQLNLHYMGASVIGSRHGVMATLGEFNRIMRKAGGPWMAVKHGFGAAWSHMRDPEKNGVSMFDMIRNNLSAREKMVADELVATGHIHKDSGLDLTPIGDSRSALSRVSRFIRDSSGSMDVMGRIVTGVAAYNKEFAKNGGDHEAALLYARQSIEKGLVHYGAGMRAPALSGPLSRIVSQFRLPSMNMLYLYGRNAYLAFRSSDKATRNEAYRALGAMLIGGWALSGSSALPTEPLKVLGILGSTLGITPSVSTINDELRRGLANEFGATAANVIMDGPLSLLGPYAPSFAHRVASPELTFGEPDSSKPDDVQKWLAGMAFGAVGSYGVNVARGAQAMFGGDPVGAAKYLLPKQLADVAKAYGLYSGGKLDAGAAAMQAFGVRSQQTVRQQEGQNALYNRMEADKTAKSAAVKAATTDRSAMLKWNAANPSNKITLSELQAAKKSSVKVLGQKVSLKNKALVEEYERTYQ